MTRPRPLSRPLRSSLLAAAATLPLLLAPPAGAAEPPADYMPLLQQRLEGGWLRRQFEEFRTWPQLDQAIRLQEAGDLAGARRAVEGLLADRPDDPRGQFLLTVLAQSMGDPETAMRAAGEVLRLQPGFGPALLYRGLALAALGRPAEASDDLAQAANATDLTEADRTTALDALVEAAIAAGRFDMALSALAGAGREESHRYQMLLGSIRDGQQDFAAAQAAFRRAAELAGDERERAEALRFAAEAARKAGEPAAARALLLELLQERPDDPAVLRQLAWLDAAGGDLAGAQAWIGRILDGSPDAETRVYLVNLLVEAGALEEGIALARRQLGTITDPALRHRLLMLLGHLNFQTGDLVASALAFREAAEALQDPEALVALATVYEQSDNLEQAAALLEEMAERFGLEGVAYRLIALYERMGDDRAALRVIERAATADADPAYRADLSYRRSVILGRLGDRAGALAALAEAAALQPDNPFYRLALGELRFAAGEYPAAVEAFAAALELAPERDTRRRLAVAQAAAGQVAEAVASFELLLPDAPRGSEERAEILARLGNLHALQERFAESGRAFLDAHAERPGQDPQLLVQAGLSFGLAGDWDQAAAALARAIADPATPPEVRREARERAAVVAEQRDRPAEAVQQYLALVEDPAIAPEHRLTLLNRLAVVAELARDYPAASRAYAGIAESPLAEPQARRTALSRLAVTAELAGDYDTAIAAYRRILDAPGLDDAERLDALRRLAIVANVAGRLDVAREAYEILVAGNALPLQARLEAARSLAYVAQLTGQPAGVVEALSGLLEAPEIAAADRVEVLEGIALAADLAGRPQVVVDAYERALAMAPRQGEARDRLLENLAAAYERVGRPGDAIPLYRDRLQRLGSGQRQHRMDLLERLAMASEQAGDRAGAREALAELIGLGAEDPAIFERYGLSLRDMGDCPEALQAFEQARRRGAGAQADIYTAFCQVDLGRPGLALHYLRQALARPDAGMPESSRLLLLRSLGFLLAETGQQAEAAAALRRVADLAPEPDLLLALARAERLSGEIATAQAVLDRLSVDELPPTLRPDYLDEVAEVRQAQGDLDGALAALDGGIALDPSAPRLFRRGVLLSGLGREEAALADLEAAHRAAPENAEITAALGYALIARGDDAAAAALLEPVVRAEPDRLPLYEDLAYLDKRLNRNDTASAWYERAIDNRPLHTVDNAGQAAELERRIFGLRRENQVLHDRWDASGYAIMRSEIAGAPRFDPSGRSSLVAQGGVELAHRPDWLTLPDGSPLGFRDGSTLHAYGRMFWGFEKDSLKPDTDTLQAGFGLRWKPLGDINLVLSGERLVPLGDAARDGWLLRVGHSWDMGVDYNPVEKDWWMAQTYLDAAWIPGSDGALFLNAEARLGRSYRLPEFAGIAPVLTPHVLAAGSYTRDSFDSERYTELGIGISGRLWFDETPHQAWRGVGEISLQYRAGIDSDNKLSHGPVLTLTIAF